jgi:hypothetical protein
MLYKLHKEQEINLLNLPETGMGFQIIEAKKENSYSFFKYLVLNSEIVIDFDGTEDIFVKRVFSEGLISAKEKANYIILGSITLLNELNHRNFFNEMKTKGESGAKDNKVEYANGKEVFVRLSAFENDKRIDKVNNCLLPGSYTTTIDDYEICKNSNDDSIERYALPNNDQIKHAFHILPLNSDTLQRGIVQPANGKRGGGKEVYFENGTANGTFILQTPY